MAGATRAWEPERVWGGPSLPGMSAFGDLRSGLAEWVRHRRSKDFVRLALMPCARQRWRTLPATLLERR